MEYRANFITSSLNSVGQLAGTLFTINILYSKNYQFGASAGDPGWSLDASYLVVALFTLLDGITVSVLSPNLSRIVGHVQRGTLDFILLKPLDPQIQLSTRGSHAVGFSECGVWDRPDRLCRPAAWAAVACVSAWCRGDRSVGDDSLCPGVHCGDVVVLVHADLERHGRAAVIY